jgi:hypothetical protein
MTIALQIARFQGAVEFAHPTGCDGLLVLKTGARPPEQALRRGLDGLYADRLRSLVPGLLFIGHLHPLVERPKALFVDLVLVHEQVLVSLVCSDEAEPLSGLNHLTVPVGI